MEQLLPGVQEIEDEYNMEKVSELKQSIIGKYLDLIEGVGMMDKIKVSDQISHVLDGFKYLKDNDFHGSVTARRAEFKTCQKITVTATAKKTVNNYNHSEVMTSEIKILDRQYDK